MPKRRAPDGWYDWKSHPITKAMFSTVQKAIYDTQVRLGHDAGLNPAHDRFLAGTIHAYENVLNIDYEEVEPQYGDLDDKEEESE